MTGDCSEGADAYTGNASDPDPLDIAVSEVTRTEIDRRQTRSSEHRSAIVWRSASTRPQYGEGCSPGFLRRDPLFPPFRPSDGHCSILAPSAFPGDANVRAFGPVPKLRLNLKTTLYAAVLAAACSCNKPADATRGGQSSPADTKEQANRPKANAVDKAGPGNHTPTRDAKHHLPAARALANEVIVLDGHVDVPMRVVEAREEGQPELDLSADLPQGNFDYAKAKRGGLDAPFMSIYIPATYENAGAKVLAEQLIDMVRGFADRWPDKFALATTVAEIELNFAAGKISLPMGMENGAPLEGKLENVAHFHERGIRYITLAHSKDNHISDSSYDDRHSAKGLTKFGKKVVAEMNRVGIMVDVSHISDDAFRQVIELSAVPVIASHSACRKFTPGWERNMDDWMIRMLADNGGVIQINFGSSFISDCGTRSAKRRPESHRRTDRGRENGTEE